MSAMAMESNGRDEVAAGSLLIVRVREHIKKKVVSVAKNVKKVGEDDPRRILHSFKVGLALTFVSLLYYLRPLYDGFGMAGIWAVLTVVVVFEYSVGATLSKGLNRAFATMLAGALAVGVHYLANRSNTAEPVIIGVFVFIIAAAATFTRFFPRVKARYDYGAMIFILTFSLVAVTGYRDDELFEMAYERLSTVVIGGLVCVSISIFICPVWAGADLHQVAANNLDKLASFLEGFGSEFFKIRNEVELEISTVNEEEKVEMKAFSQVYKSILLSKTGEESLANFARWEPGHGRFRFGHPWRQYLKIGGLARQCAYSIEALNACINSKNQGAADFRQHVQGPCARMSLESGKALKELSEAIRGMIKPISAVTHVMSAKAAADELKPILKSALPEEFDILEIVPMATIASLLVEIVGQIEEMHRAVDKLAVEAKFKNAAQVEPTPSQHHRSTVAPLSDEADEQHVVIEIGESVPSDDIHCNSVTKIAPIEHVDKY